MNWVSDIEFDVDSNFGFIYLVEYENGKKYIGKKNFHSYRKKPLTKKELSFITDKRLKSYRVVKTESNWRAYTGSCSLSKGLKLKEKRIIHVCKEKIDLTYWESFYLFTKEVLFDDTYLNQNLEGRYFSGKLTGSKEHIK